MVKRFLVILLLIVVTFLTMMSIISFTSAWDFSSDGTGGTSSVSLSTTTYTGNLTNLSQMQDVNIPTPTDAYILTYDSASGKWIASLPSAGAELDPKWTGNWTNFSTIYAYAINDTNYNASGLIKDWNVSGYIKNWWIDIVNGTVGGITWANVINGTMLKASDWNATNISYYLATNPYNFWNSTFATFNKTYADTLYYGLSNPYSYYNSTNPSPTYNATYNAYNSTGLIKDWNSTGYIKDWNASGYIKNWDTSIASANTSLYNWITGQSYTAGGITWANAINGTLALASSIPTNNNQLTNGFSFYNVTTAPIYLNDTFRGANYSTFLTHTTWANVINGTMLSQATYNTNYSTLMLQSTFNTNYTTNDLIYRNQTNTSYLLKAGDSMTGSLNITVGNLSVSNRIKLAVGDCSSLVAGEICRNATAIYIQG